jgi:hypothetical protein
MWLRPFLRHVIVLHPPCPSRSLATLIQSRSLSPVTSYMTPNFRRNYSSLVGKGENDAESTSFSVTKHPGTARQGRRPLFALPSSGATQTVGGKPSFVIRKHNSPDRKSIVGKATRDVEFRVHLELRKAVELAASGEHLEAWKAATRQIAIWQGKSPESVELATRLLAGNGGEPLTGPSLYERASALIKSGHKPQVITDSFRTAVEYLCMSKDYVSAWALARPFEYLGPAQQDILCQATLKGLELQGKFPGKLNLVVEAWTEDDRFWFHLLRDAAMILQSDSGGYFRDFWPVLQLYAQRYELEPLQAILGVKLHEQLRPDGHLMHSSLPSAKRLAALSKLVPKRNERKHPPNWIIDVMATNYIATLTNSRDIGRLHQYLLRELRSEHTEVSQAMRGITLHSVLNKLGEREEHQIKALDIARFLVDTAGKSGLNEETAASKPGIMNLSLWACVVRPLLRYANADRLRRLNEICSKFGIKTTSGGVTGRSEVSLNWTPPLKISVMHLLEQLRSPDADVEKVIRDLLVLLHTGMTSVVGRTAERRTETQARRMGYDNTNEFNAAVLLTLEEDRRLHLITTNAKATSLENMVRRQPVRLPVRRIKSALPGVEDDWPTSSRTEAFAGIQSSRRPHSKDGGRSLDALAAALSAAKAAEERKTRYLLRKLETAERTEARDSWYDGSLRDVQDGSTGDIPSRAMPAGDDLLDDSPEEDKITRDIPSRRNTPDRTSKSGD